MTPLTKLLLVLPLPIGSIIVLLLYARRLGSRESGEVETTDGIRFEHVVVTGAVTVGSFLLPLVLSPLWGVPLERQNVGLPETGFGNIPMVLALLVWIAVACPGLVAGNVLAAWLYRVRSIWTALARSIIISSLAGTAMWLRLVSAFRLDA